MPVAILMPALSPTMTEGNVAKWLKKIGEDIKPGDIIAEVETDKATMEVEAIDEGVLAKIIHDDGAENITVNSLIGVISIDGETDDDIEEFLKKNGKPQAKSKEIDETKEKKQVNEVNVDEAINTINNTNDEVEDANSVNEEFNNIEETYDQPTKVSISPLAKRIATLKSININKITGSGPRGRIVKKDLDSILQLDNKQETNISNKKERKEFQTSSKIPLTNMRKTIAARLQKSKQTIPHFYLKCKICAEEIIKTRKIINSLDNNEKDKIKVSYNDIIIKAVASALKAVPAMNRTWNEDSVMEYSLVDISVAVATNDGLFTPVIRSACQKPITEISFEMKEFIKKAKNNKLIPDDYSGGSFSISNLGMYNIHEFSAIINPPQSGILAVGEIFGELTMDNDKVLQKNMINLVLSVDHRVADGAIAAVFLDKVKFFLENPLGMLA